MLNVHRVHNIKNRQRSAFNTAGLFAYISLGVGAILVKPINLDNLSTGIKHCMVGYTHSNQFSCVTMRLSPPGKNVFTRWEVMFLTAGVFRSRQNKMAVLSLN